MSKKRESEQIQLTDSDLAKIDEMAQELGVDAAHVRQGVEFTAGVKQLIADGGLDGQQAFAGLMSVVTDLLNDHFPVMPRRHMVSEICHTLWDACGLSAGQDEVAAVETVSMGKPPLVH